MSQTFRKRKEKLKLDQIMRVLFKLSNKMTIQLVNGLFAESFAEEEVLGIRYGNSEFIRDDYDRIVGDLFLTLTTQRGTFHYHVEFQTLNDQSMVIRMFRYGFEKAVELTKDGKKQAVGAAGKSWAAAQEETAATAEILSTAAGDATEAERAEERTVIAFPQQLVIFLEENEAIGDELSFQLRLPNGAEIPYIVPVMKYWAYSSEELRARRMYALLPLQVFGSRKRMRALYESSRPKAEKTQLMMEEFERLKLTIRKMIEILGELHDGKEIATGDLDRMLRVIDSITAYLYSRYKEYQTIGEEMSQMIKTFIDPKIWEAGKQEGIREGIEKERREVAQKLLSLGIEIDKVIEATGLSKEEVLNLDRT